MTREEILTIRATGAIESKAVIRALCNMALNGLQPEDGGITKALVQMARDNAIEECAKVCDAVYRESNDSRFPDMMYRQGYEWGAELCEQRISALKGEELSQEQR